MTREIPSQEFIEQKITQQVTIIAGTSGTVEIDIPREKTVFLKGYGYTWFTLNKYKLSTGNTSFPVRTDQEGSPAIPALFGTPFKCRSGGKLKISITNGDSSDHTYDIVFYIISNELLEVESIGGDLNLTIGGATGTASAVSIVDTTGTTSADVTSDGLQVYTNKALPVGSNTIGDVTVSSIPVSLSPDTLLCGTKVTVDASAIAIATSTTVHKVTLQADVNNTDALFIGNATNQKIRLDIGQSIDLEINNLNKIYIKRNGSSNQTINYIGA